MNEYDWYLCGAKKPMLCYLREKGLLSPRKQVLLAYASIGPAALQDPYYELAARFVDGKAGQGEIEAALLALEREKDADSNFRDYCHNTHADEVYLHRNLLQIACGEASILDIDTGGLLASNPFSPSELSSPQFGVGVFLIHELFGDPFRTVAVNPAWLTWNEGTIVRLAREMYEAAEFGRMPALADALQNAGCNDATILHHCRQSPLHVRGCWVIDLLLGKERVGAELAAAPDPARR